MIESVNLTLLEEYINGEISANEVLHEDGQPLSKTELDAALMEFDDLKIHLKAAGLEKRLKSIHRDVEAENSRSKLLRRWSVAAAVVLIATFSFLLLRPDSSPEFSNYFNHFDQLVAFRNSDSTSYSAGLAAYSLKDYDLAYQSLQSIDDLDDELKFYLGISALGSSRPKRAVQIFDQLDSMQSYKYYQQVKWYLGLAHWQSGDVESAIDVLSRILKDEYQYTESQKLVRELKD